MKPDEIELLSGCALIALFSGWAVIFLCKRLWSNVKSGSVVDSTLSERSQEDAPGLYLVQVSGFLMLIGAASLIAIGAMIKFVQVIYTL
jgi:hypothetical protein